MGWRMEQLLTVSYLRSILSSHLICTTSSLVCIRWRLRPLTSGSRLWVLCDRCSWSRCTAVCNSCRLHNASNCFRVIYDEVVDIVVINDIGYLLRPSRLLFLLNEVSWSIGSTLLIIDRIVNSVVIWFVLNWPIHVYKVIVLFACWYFFWLLFDRRILFFIDRHAWLVSLRVGSNSVGWFLRFVNYWHRIHITFYSVILINFKV